MTLLARSRVESRFWDGIPGATHPSGSAMSIDTGPPVEPGVPWHRYPMITPRRPSNEDERLAHLYSLDVLDTPAEERFDRITRLAKGLFEVPIVLISLVDEKRQWFKSRQGLTACETSREISFCGHAILGDELLVIEDATADERFHDNPLVVQEPEIRFYAGCPLRDAAGLRLGTLCLIDTRPRRLSAAAREQLRDLGRIAEGELSILKLGLTQLEQVGWEPDDRRQLLDEVTGTWNEGAMLEIARRGIQRSAAAGAQATLVVAHVRNAGEVSETWTRDGAAILKAEVAQAMRSAVQTHDAVGILEDGFLILLMGCSGEQVEHRVERIEEALAGNSVLQALGIDVELAFATSDAHPDGPTATELIGRARESLAGNAGRLATRAG